MIIKILAITLKLSALYYTLFSYQCVLAKTSMPLEFNIKFSSPENVQQKISSINNPNVLIVSFAFDPFAPKLLESYLPDGYITVNGEYDVNALVIKTFFAPLFNNFDNDNLKFLIIDLNPFLKNPTQSKIRKVKNLTESLAADFAKRKRSINLGFKFQYNQSSRESIDELFSYTAMQMDVKSMQIESGFCDFFSQKKYQNYLRQLKYLNVQNNIIGSDKETFNDFLFHLKSLNNLEILNLSDNALGAVNGNLKLFGNQILAMKKLQHLNLANNLIGAYKEDSDEFIKSIQKIKHLNVNLNYNLN